MTNLTPQPTTTTTEPPTELHHTINNLLEEYLSLLHEYHTLQQALGGHLSSGFLSLAAANFSNLASRFGYGQDFYDERMRALNLISISPLDTNNTFTLLPAPAPASTQETPSLSPLAPAPAPTPASPRDPLDWFGILVPPALRQAQGSFKTAVEKDIMGMATTATEMRGVEDEIQRARKRIKTGKGEGDGGLEGHEGGVKRS